MCDIINIFHSMKGLKGQFWKHFFEKPLGLILYRSNLLVRESSMSFWYFVNISNSLKLGNCNFQNLITFSHFSNCQHLKIVPIPWNSAYTIKWIIMSDQCLYDWNNLVSDTIITWATKMRSKIIKEFQKLFPNWTG